MKKTNEIVLVLGKVKVTFNKATSSGMIVTLTSNVNGFKLIMKLNNGVIKKIKDTIYKSRAVNSGLYVAKPLTGLYIKCREYTIGPGESEMSYKFYDTKKGFIEMHSVNGCVIVRIANDEHERTHCNFCFEAETVIREIERITPVINRIAGEEMLNEWF